ncbi:SGNH/GDSL hydrolase family protein [Desulfosarcina widdelii]|nr:SGNH/GDSL hydrolase family protein [Desulfosarcina widdelii]
MKNYTLLVISIIVFFLVQWLVFPASHSIAADIIDNGDPETSFSGNWSNSSGTDPWDPNDPGANSLWSRNGTTYTWTFTPEDSGYHDLEMWWTEWPSRSDHIPVDIEYWGNTDRIYINQGQNGGQWNLLNTYPFEAGTEYNITITSQPGPSSTCADAIKLTFVPNYNIKPMAVIDSISPNPAAPSDLVRFSGHGEDLDGSISQYNWYSNIDGHLGTTANFTTDIPLSAGSHQINLIVYDDDGEPSEPVSQTLVVQESVNEWVIDNGDPGTSFTGIWRISGALNSWDPEDPEATSLWSRDGSIYKWTFTPSVSGNHTFSMWWTEWSSRSDSIPLTIVHDYGTDSLIINQQANGGRWNLLGTYYFTAGKSYDITITSQPGPSSTCADAVKFNYVGGDINLPPVSVIEAITPISTVPQEEITFMGTGIDSDGTVASYAWESDIDGIISDQETFSTNSLTPGIHTIFFRVQDNKGTWSKDDTALIVVRDCASPVAIMPLGDSITLGYGESTTSQQMIGYRGELYQQLAGDGYFIDFVGNQTDGLFASGLSDLNHQGIGGITASSVAENVYAWLVENPAEIILLHIGTNGFTTNPIYVEDVLDEIDMFESETGRDVAVILARIINRQPYHQETTTFNENLQVMAESRIAAGDKLVLVDQENVLNYATDMWDTWHPNNQGYAKMSGPWMDEVIGLLPICGTFGPFIYTTPILTSIVDSEYTYRMGALGEPSPTFQLISAPSGMTIGQSTGVVSWVPTSGQKGNHSVIVQATNSLGMDEQRFTVDVTAETIIIDNGDAGTFSTGAWYVSGGADPYDPNDRAANSLYSRDNTTYTWTFTPSVSGTYQFSMWWTEYPSRNTMIPVSVDYSGGTDSLFINQSINGGMWNSLGSYPFNAGESYNITLIAQPGPSSTCADAVKFVREF